MKTYTVTRTKCEPVPHMNTLRYTLEIINNSGQGTGEFVEIEASTYDAFKSGQRYTMTF